MTVAFIGTLALVAGCRSSTGPDDALIGTWRGATATGDVVGFMLSTTSDGVYTGYVVTITPVDSGSCSFRQYHDYAHIEATLGTGDRITLAVTPNDGGPHGLSLDGTHTTQTISGTLQGDVTGAIVFTKQ